MPNWCTGDLKIRGKKEDLVKFLKECLVSTGYFGISNEEVAIEEQKYMTTFSLKNSKFHIKGTRRSFIDSECIEIWWDNNGEEEIIILEDYETAWALDTEALTKLSKEYNIDFKIFAFERGMEFNLDYEVVKGEVVKNKEITFDNYRWECISPMIGG